MVDRLLDAVRGAFPDMADIVASTLRLQFGAVLLDTFADAQRFQFISLAADDQDGPEAIAMGSIPDEAVFLSESGEEVPSIIMRRGVDLAMVAYGVPVIDIETADATARRELSNRLDIALNGAAGATGASLVKLVAQVERQQRAVHIVNFDDGMVINFRAPDGRRTTLHLARILLAAANGAAIEMDPGADNTIREAIYAYPSVGPRVPEMHFGLRADTMTPAQHERVGKVYDHFDEPFDSHPDEVAAVHAAMNLYVRTGELPK